MRLTVLKPNTRYRGEIYQKGDTFEVDMDGHNVAQEIRFLKAVGRVAQDAPVAAPVGRVASTQPAPAADPAPAAPPVEPVPTPTEPPKAEDHPVEPKSAPAKSGRYQRRDLRAKD